MAPSPGLHHPWFLISSNTPLLSPTFQPDDYNSSPGILLRPPRHPGVVTFLYYEFSTISKFFVQD